MLCLWKHTWFRQLLHQPISLHFIPLLVPLRSGRINGTPWVSISFSNRNRIFFLSVCVFLFSSSREFALLIGLNIVLMACPLPWDSYFAAQSGAEGETIWGKGDTFRSHNDVGGVGVVVVYLLLKNAKIGVLSYDIQILSCHDYIVFWTWSCSSVGLYAFSCSILAWSCSYELK